MKKKLLALLAIGLAYVSFVNAQTNTATEKSKVYFTSEITNQQLEIIVLRSFSVSIASTLPIL
ncbi:MAG: hypothetical protein K2J70_02150 [Muribaculaceae bacterium]|nr:hypothetical protein [Muribaculaceae bacterium]